MVGNVCPKCGSRVLPDCNDTNCKARYCVRNTAQCGWESDDLCIKFHVIPSDAMLAEIGLKLEPEESCV